MEKFIKGDIVVIPFPYSDLTNAKRRPALVIAESSNNDFILCQITSQEIKDAFSVKLLESDFLAGSLNRSSNIRPNKIFTADERIILYKIGSLTPGKISEIIDAIIKILKS
jgi:mRNA interferase MazF